MNLTNKQYDTIKLIGLIAVPVIVFLSAVVSILKSLYEKKQKETEKEGDPND